MKGHSVLKFYSQNQRGSALLLSILLMSVLALIATMINMNKISNEKTKLQRMTGLTAENVAEAGIEHALQWFRKQQAALPVNEQGNPIRKNALPYEDAAFQPLNFDPLHPNNTNYSDTIDESTGIVKEYSLADAVHWARYEVRRQPVGDLNANAVHDITHLRIPGHTSGEGLVWEVVSKGYIFQKLDAAKLYDQLPNKIIARATSKAELWSLQLNLATDANGNPPAMNAATTASKMFGVSPNDLRALADVVVSTLGQLPINAMSDPHLIFMDSGGNLKPLFNSSDTLNAAIYANGDTVISAAGGGNVNIWGVLFVKGNLRIENPCNIRGALVVTEKISILSPDVHIVYDTNKLTTLKRELGKYRKYHSESILTRLGSLL